MSHHTLRDIAKKELTAARLVRDILICSSYPDSIPGCNAQLRRLMDHLPDKGLLLHSADLEGMTGLLYRKLRKTGLLSQLSGAERRQIESGYFKIAADNLRLSQDLKEVLLTLNQKKIRTAVLQGMSVLPLYKDIGLRPMNDIDIWILENDYPNADALLQHLGYKKDPLYPGSYRKGMTKFDVRTHFFWAERIGSRKSMLAVSQEKLFADLQITQLDDASMLTLNRYDQVVYLTLHAIKHYLACLIWLVDILRLTEAWQASDWHRCKERAEMIGQPKAVSYALFLKHYLFASADSGAFSMQPELMNLNTFERYLLRRRKKSGALPTWTPLYLFATGGKLTHRVVYIFETLFPRPEILRQVFPSLKDPRNWQLYCMRFFQLYGKAVRSILFK